MYGWQRSRKKSASWSRLPVWLTSGIDLSILVNWPLLKNMKIIVHLSSDTEITLSVGSAETSWSWPMLSQYLIVTSLVEHSQLMKLLKSLISVNDDEEQQPTAYRFLSHVGGLYDEESRWWYQSTIGSGEYRTETAWWYRRCCCGELHLRLLYRCIFLRPHTSCFALKLFESILVGY